MTGEEIAKKIAQNESRLVELMDPTRFILRKEVQDLIAENFELRKKCPHCFVDGKCVYCGEKENE